MKKRGIFSLVVLLTLTALFAAQTTTDIGTAYELVISDVALSEAETNNASSVSVITKKQIEAYNVSSTGELINKAIGTNFNSYGSLGAAQTVVIRGAGSSKNLIFLDGVLLSSAHDGSVDLSIIPVNTIERIEIIKNGSGNLGRTNAIGGMINIITKKGEAQEKPFSFTAENGSFLPEAYGAAEQHNYLSLLDSQKMDLTYTNTLQGTRLVANVGGIVAQNAYTYDNGTPTKELRDNAQVYAAHASLNASRDLASGIEFSSSNLVNYQHLNTPGNSSSPTPEDFQENLLVTTMNTATFSDLGDSLDHLKAEVNYSYSRTFFHSPLYGDSTHNKNKGNILAEVNWETGDTFNAVTGADLTFDYVDSTDVGQRFRLNPALYAHASLYLLDGTLSLHPNVSLAYLSDRKAFSPNAALGAIYVLDSDTELRATVSYAENVPTFSDLYWPWFGNETLETEKGIQGDFGIQTKYKALAYEGSIFTRNIHQEIILDAFWIPQNLGHSVYLGTEQALTLQMGKHYALSASYLYNKSFDLSNGQSFSDNVEVTNVRKHTAKASASVSYGIFDGVLSGEFLGKTKAPSSQNIVVLNLSMNAQITEDLKIYLAIDNLLNASYELTSGYPMPGMKIRVGGTVQF